MTTRPTDIALADPILLGRAAGRLVGTLSGTDPQGDPLVFSVSDPRFVVVGDQLYTSQDFDLGNAPRGPVALRITATDPGGLSLVKLFRLPVTPGALDQERGASAASADGANGAGGLAAGEAGGDGAAPLPVGASIDPPAGGRPLLGSAMDDHLRHQASVVGGLAGSGGSGADGGSGPEGSGGAGGAGGDGGAVVAGLVGLSFSFRQGGSDQLALVALAQGGDGGAGGHGGQGAAAGPDAGEPGGASAGGDGGDGGAGGIAYAVLARNTLLLGTAEVTLRAQATGGDGGAGGVAGPGGAGGDGLEPGDAGFSGWGGMGGLSQALIVQNTISASGALKLDLIATARIGQPGLDAEGAPGDGGAAAALVADNAITGSALADVVRIRADTDGGVGGIADNVIRLGRGDDLLALTIAFDSCGCFDQTVLSGNTLDGGAGFDTLDLSGTGAAGGAGVVVDLYAGRMGVTPDGASTITGFEAVIGGGGADVLAGGRSDAVLTGGGGDDVFVLRRTLTQTVITDFHAAEGDLLILVGFGSLLSGADRFSAAVVDTAGGALLSYSYAGRAAGILFQGATEADLMAAYDTGAIAFHPTAPDFFIG